MKACVNFTVTRSRAVSSQEMIIECCFNHSKLWVCAVLWLLWLDKPNKQTNQRGHLIMHALLCKMANGDLMLHSQTTVSTQHSTVPELGAWPVGLDRIWLISWWNLQFVTPTLWTTVVMCKPSALAFSRRCVNTSSRAHCTNLLSLVLRCKKSEQTIQTKKIKTLLVVRGEEVGHCLLLPLVQAVWQGANRPKETDLHPVKKLVAGFHLPNHENILSKVRNQGEEVA